MESLTDRFIKLVPASGGPHVIMPASTEAHFVRKNSRSTEKERVRILKPTVKEVIEAYPEYSEEAEAELRATKTVATPPIVVGAAPKATVPFKGKPQSKPAAKNNAKPSPK